MYYCRLALTALTVGVVLLTACGAPESTRPQGLPSGGERLAESQVLKVRFYDDPSGFDPATLFRIETENIAFNIYSGLTTYESKTGRLIPDLAERWETTDQRHWTFHLRKGVKWQKGYGELSAGDVIYSYQRILDPATGSPYRTQFANVDSIQAPDSSTVAIALKTPDANFLHQVANYHQGQVLKKEAVEKAGDQYKWNPAGTGPFAFESFTPGSEIVLTRHEGYFRGTPALERIHFRIIKDDDTGAIALQNGEVDFAMRIRSEEALKRLQADGRFDLNPSEIGNSTTIFNLQVKPLSDIRVRRAWAHALDYDAIVKAVGPLSYKKASGLLPQWMDVYTDDVPRYEYNPERARQLLREAGYPNGFTVKHPATAATGVTELQQLEQSYLARVGINVEYELLDTPVFNQRRNRGDFDVAGRLFPAANPDTILFSYLHPDNMAPGGLNGARYNNPEVTSKLEAARAEGDSARRKQLYAEVQRLALTDLAYWPATTNLHHWPSYKWVRGVALNPLTQVNYYEVSILAH